MRAFLLFAVLPTFAAMYFANYGGIQETANLWALWLLIYVGIPMLISWIVYKIRR